RCQRVPPRDDPRMAARAHPGHHRHGHADRHDAGRCRADGDDLRVEGAGLPARRVPAQARLRRRPGHRRRARRDRRGHELHRRRHLRPHRPPSEVLMDTLKRLPVVSHVRQAVGLQRGMLIVGLVICALELLAAALAPLIAPYGYAQMAYEDGSRFGAQLALSAAHIWGTTVCGYDVFSRVVWGARTAVSVIVVAVVLSLFAGVALGLISGYIGGWLDRILVVVADAIYAFPSLLLAIVMAIVISGGQSSAWGGILAAAASITVV